MFNELFKVHFERIIFAKVLTVINHFIQILGFQATHPFPFTQTAFEYLIYFLLCLS